MGLADLHIHTIYSHEGTAPVAAILNRAKEVGLNVIAISDHDEIKGSLLDLTVYHTFTDLNTWQRNASPDEPTLLDISQDMSLSQ